MRFMLDTTTLQPPDAGQSSGRGRKFPPRVGDVVMSAVTYAELCYGVERHHPAREQAAAALGGWSKIFPRCRSTRPPAQAAAHCGRRYGVAGGCPDRLIAAHAVSRDLILVTNNEAVFLGTIRASAWKTGRLRRPSAVFAKHSNFCSIFWPLCHNHPQLSRCSHGRQQGQGLAAALQQIENSSARVHHEDGRG